jgi:hypothetical protein
MFRGPAVAVIVLVCILAGTTLVVAQAQPLVVFIARSVLGGFASGVAHRAGEEFYDRMRDGNVPQQNPEPPRPTYPPSTPAQSSVVPPSSPPVGPVPPPVPPHGLRWGFRNLHYNVVGIQFYASRPSGRHVWPGPGRAYLFKSGDHHIVRLGCQPGEKVCFGAWSQGTRQTFTHAADRVHSITSSARADRPGGTSKPSAFAVFRLITISNLTACITGKSAGFAPLTISAA